MVITFTVQKMSMETLLTKHYMQFDPDNLFNFEVEE